MCVGGVQKSKRLGRVDPFLRSSSLSFFLTLLFGTTQTGPFPMDVTDDYYSKGNSG